MDVVIVSQLGKVSRNSDALFTVVAGTKPCLRMVERETPRLIQVKPDEGVCPHGHSMKFSHVFRVGGEQALARELSTVSPFSSAR